MHLIEINLMSVIDKMPTRDGKLLRSEVAKMIRYGRKLSRSGSKFSYTIWPEICMFPLYDNTHQKISKHQGIVFNRSYLKMELLFGFESDSNAAAFRLKFGGTPHKATIREITNS